MLRNRMTERGLQKLEQLAPRGFIMQLIVDADMPAVLRQCVHRHGWIEVLEMLQNLAQKEEHEARLREEGIGGLALLERRVCSLVLELIPWGREWGRRG